RSGALPEAAWVPLLRPVSADLQPRRTHDPGARGLRRLLRRGLGGHGAGAGVRGLLGDPRRLRLSLHLLGPGRLQGLEERAGQPLAVLRARHPPHARPRHRGDRGRRIALADRRRVMNATAATASANDSGFKGNDSALLGIVLAVVTFWLFAQTTMNIGPLMADDVGMPMPVMNIAISLSALFSGMFIVVLGGLGDRFGRVKVVFFGNVLNIAGSLLIAFAIEGGLATPMILLGRILQGLAAGAIMPCTMALLKVYWDGKDRQRAVSMWSIGSWGGSGLTAIFGGFMASTVLGWRSIFVICALVSVASIALMRQIPESAPLAGRPGKTDWVGIISLATGLAALLIVVTQGSSIGWTNLMTWGLFALFLVAFGVFVNAALGEPHPLVDFNLFRTGVFTGATISNFLINGTAGALTVSLWVLQGAAGMSAATAGYLTAGYAIFIIAFIRVGEKLLQRFGPRKPMLWGCLIVLVS